MTRKDGLVTSLLVLWLVLTCIVIALHLTAHRPAVAPDAPIPAAVVDTGWHAALDAHGNLYVLDLPYSEMNDSQKDDANRFGRLYPEGT